MGTLEWDGYGKTIQLIADKSFSMASQGMQRILTAISKVESRADFVLISFIRTTGDGVIPAEYTFRLVLRDAREIVSGFKFDDPLNPMFATVVAPAWRDSEFKGQSELVKSILDMVAECGLTKIEVARE